MSVMAEDITRSIVTNSSQVHRDAGELRRPLKLRFFINGDRYFRGKKVYVMPNRYHSFNDLLNDLTGKLPSNVNLPYGVRQIFTPVSGRRIHDIAGLTEGDMFVCAGFEGFKVIKYGRAALEPWSMARPQLPNTSEVDSEYLGSYRYRGYAGNAFHPGRYFRANQTQQYRRWPGAFGSNQRGSRTTHTEGVGHKPRVITVVRSGPRPRFNIKILLNRKSVLSYEQLMADISEALGGRTEGSKGQRLFGINGKEVQGVSDFFRNINFFIAIGAGEAELSNENVFDILTELFPEGKEAEVYMKEWDKSQRRIKKTAFSEDEADKFNPIGKIDPIAFHPQEKRDSGFDSSNTAIFKSENDHAQVPEHKAKPRIKKKTKREPKKEVTENNNDWSSELNQNYTAKNESLKREREKINRRVQKIIDTERRIREEEQRKRDQLPTKALANPLINTERGTKPKDSLEVAQNPDDKSEEDEKALLERKQREREEREAAERAARHRMALAERLEREEREKELLKAEQLALEAKQQSLNVVEPARADPGSIQEIKSEHVADHATSGKKQENVIVINDDQLVRKDAIAESETTPAAGEKEVIYNVPPEPDNHSVGIDHTLQRQPNEKRKQDKEERQHRKRAKTKIVRKTKEERQVDSDNVINQRYELGKKLGDGNFAIVQQSRNKETGQEVAIKVIDKAKLKGKERMVENEIDIMKDCSHQNIVRLYEEYETPERIYLVMELVKGGDLFDAITQSIKFGEKDSAIMVKDLCNALFYLHSRSIVHRDLKPENLLVHRNKDGTISLKLADFGLAMEVKELIYTVCGTPTYVAPEILSEIGYGLEVDMWAVGVITYILLCGFPPFRSPNRNQTELFELIKAGDYQFLSPYWDNTSRSAKDLIGRLLIVDRKKRYTSVDVLCHRWIVCNGQPDIVPLGAPSVEMACKDARRELELQAKVNFDHYQKLKEKKKREKEKKEE